MKTLTAIVSLLLVSACSTMTDAQRERDDLYSKVRQVSRDAQSCYNNLSAKPKYEPLYRNFALKRKGATPAELSNSDRVSDEMVALLLDWYASHQICDSSMVNGYQRLDASLGLVAIKWLQDRARSLQRIVSDRPSYGRANAELDAIKIRESNELKAWLARTERQFASRHVSELDTQERESQRERQVAGEAVSTIVRLIFQAIVELADMQVALAESQQRYAARQPQIIVVQPIQPTIRTSDCSPNPWGGFRCSHF